MKDNNKNQQPKKDDKKKSPTVEEINKITHQKPGNIIRDKTSTPEVVPGMDNPGTRGPSKKDNPNNS